MIRSMRLGATGVAVALSLASLVRAQLDVGPEFQVNTYTAGDQRHPGATVHADGEFTIAWDGGDYYHSGPGSDGSSMGVFLQHFASDGSPAGSEQQVNTFTRDAQMFPEIEAQPDGGFVVVWQSGCPYGTSCSPDGGRTAVALQRFDAAAAPAGEEQVVNSFTLGYQASASVGAGPAGDFVVVWASSSYYYPIPDRDYAGVFGQRFLAEGTREGFEFQVNAETPHRQFQPDVAVDGAGHFVVVWREYYYADRQYVNRVFARRFDASGTPLAGEVEVTGNASAIATSPSVAATDDGRFIVAWTEWAGGSETANVRARRFETDGSPAALAFSVNTYTTGYQSGPDVAVDGDGNFVVVWTSSGYYGAGQDGSGSAVVMQAFALDGVPLGSELQVNAYTTGNQAYVSVGGNAAGEFVVAWTSGPAYYQAGGEQDGDGGGIFARRLALRPCAAAGECDDGNQCTTDACEGDVCLNRRQPDCCANDAECSDGHPCSDDTCVSRECQHAFVPGCTACEVSEDCGLPNQCTTAYCGDDRRCVYEPIPSCCTTGADCDDDLPCTEDVCDASQQCHSNPIPGCIPCGDDATCATGCLLGPETCEAGRCAVPDGCPVVELDDAEPLGPNGGLLVNVAVPADVPGKGRIKAIITGLAGAPDAGFTPARRCREGKKLGRVKATLDPDTETNLLLELDQKAVRCLTDQADGVLELDVAVQVKRKRKALLERTEPRTWRE